MAAMMDKYYGYEREHQTKKSPNTCSFESDCLTGCNNTVALHFVQDQMYHDTGATICYAFCTEVKIE